MRRLVGVLALVFLAGGSAPKDDLLVSEREALVRQTMVEFYTHLLADHPPSKCPPILDKVDDALSEMSAKVRASLGEQDSTAALWSYLRMHREAIAPTGLEPPFRSLNIRYVSRTLGPPKDVGNITIEVMGGAGDKYTQETGVVKYVQFGLTWSDAGGRYLVSPFGLQINGIVLLEPLKRFDRPKDLWQLLGFKGIGASSQ